MDTPRLGGCPSKQSIKKKTGQHTDICPFRGAMRSIMFQFFLRAAETMANRNNSAWLRASMADERIIEEADATDDLVDHRFF